jgi:tRNA pseudouridine38-40 synthase
VSFGVLLRIAYDGERFSGWAATPGERTVQDVLRAAIATMDPEATSLRGASRTDAGVHAQGQAAAFDASRDIEMRGWVLGLGAALDEDVAVRVASQVPVGFDPRISSRKKRYRYRVLLDPVRDPLWHKRAWRIGFPLDLEKMAREAERARGTHDYRAFRSARDLRQNTMRTLDRVELVREDERIVGIVVDGNAFMHNMVRIIAGTLVDVARGKLDEGAVTRAIASGKREDLGETAPAHGLTLERVDLDVEEGERWPR